jgi:hypothetical protein
MKRRSLVRRKKRYSSIHSSRASVCVDTNWPMFISLVRRVFHYGLRCGRLFKPLSNTCEFLCRNILTNAHVLRYVYLNTMNLSALHTEQLLFKFFPPLGGVGLAPKYGRLPTLSYCVFPR